MISIFLDYFCNTLAHVILTYFNFKILYRSQPCTLSLSTLQLESGYPFACRSGRAGCRGSGRGVAAAAEKQGTRWENTIWVGATTQRADFSHCGQKRLQITPCGPNNSLWPLDMGETRDNSNYDTNAASRMKAYLCELNRKKSKMFLTFLPVLRVHLCQGHACAASPCKIIIFSSESGRLTQ